MLKIAASMVGFFLMLGAAFMSRPYYNWDMLMYVGIAETINGKSLEQAHANAYRDAANVIPSPAYQSLVNDGDYRKVVAEDPRAFREQLPFYTVKPIYPTLIALLQRAGMSGTDASILVSRLCIALLTALCCLVLSAYFKPFLAMVLGCALVATPYIFNLARYSSPDALSVLMLTVLTLLFLQPRPLSIARATAIVLAMLCRPDTVVYIIFLLTAWAVFFPAERKIAAALGIVCVGTYLTLTSVVHSYSWFILFKQSFLGPNPYPATNPVMPSVAEMFYTYFKQMHPAQSGIIVLMCVLSAVSLCCMAITFTIHDRMFAISLVCLMTLMAHWVVAPDSNDRLRSGYHLISMLFLLIAIGRLLAPQLPQRMRDIFFVNSVANDQSVRGLTENPLQRLKTRA